MELFQLAADYRYAICELTENVLASIIKSFPKVGDDTKVLICKLLHTSLIVHHPQVSGKTYEYAAAKSTWNLHIRNMMHLVQTEVLRLRNNRLANSVICEHFVLFASKLCSVVRTVTVQFPIHRLTNLSISFSGILGSICVGSIINIIRPSK